MCETPATCFPSHLMRNLKCFVRVYPLGIDGEFELWLTPSDQGAGVGANFFLPVISCSVCWMFFSANRSNQVQDAQLAEQRQDRFRQRPPDLPSARARSTVERRPTR